MRRRLLLAGLVLWFGTATIVPMGVCAAADGDTAKEEARIPFKRSAEGDSTGLAVRVVGGFVLVALLAVGAVFVMKRYLPSLYSHAPGGNRRIEVLEIRRVTPRLTLFLIEVDKTQLLLAQSGDRVEQLLQVPAAGAPSTFPASS